MNWFLVTDPIRCPDPRLIMEVEHAWGSQDTLWGCQEELKRWGRAEEEREMDMLDATREEREAFDQLVASEFVVDSEHQDTLGWLIPYDHNTGRLIWMEELIAMLFKENPQSSCSHQQQCY